MRTKPFPLSLLLAGQLRTVVFFPSDDNSSASPLVILRRSDTSGSIRAIFLPTSRCSASPTFRVIDLVSFLLAPPKLLFFLLSSSIFLDIFYHSLLAA